MQNTFTPYQKFVVGLLAFLQFTIILDFMILSPLGAILMPALDITTRQFGMVVSIYAFSAGLSSFLAAGFADRFDRKKLLLFFYAGFILGTFLCGIANNYVFLVIARMVTGIFGGVIGSIIFAITTDLFSYEMRGRVMGVVQTSFAASQIMGIPLGLYLSNKWGWHSTFMMIVGASSLVGILIIVYLRPINEHLKIKAEHSALRHLINTVSRPVYVQAFITTALLSTGGFMLMPFGSAFTVNNLGISLDKLPMIYMITGLFNIFAGPIMGKISDRFGKFNTFAGGTFFGMVMVYIYTNLGVSSVATVIIVSVLMFIGIMSRMVSSSALISAIPDPAHRGSFMSVGSSLQQVSGGLAAALAGLIVVQTPNNGPLKHFDTLGFVVIGAMLITVIMMYFINLRVKSIRAAAKAMASAASATVKV